VEVSGEKLILAYHNIHVSDGSHPGEARRIANRICEKLSFGEVRAGELSVVVTEAATNLLAHAQQGELILLGWQKNDRCGVDILALDKGPGIQDLRRSLEDGYSTAGTAGNGLGAIRRLSSHFDVYSNTAKGTALFARISEGKVPLASGSSMRFGYVLVPIAGETACGDSISVIHNGSRASCMVIDGLGHGLEAAEAAETGLRFFAQHSHEPPQQIISGIHSALRPTRGAAVAIAEIDLSTRKVRYCGIGNISATIVDDERMRSMISHNGTAGHIASRITEFLYEFPPGAMLVMHSDGVSGRWDLGNYPGLQRKHPSVVAGVIYRDHRRIRDDASVLAVKEMSE